MKKQILALALFALLFALSFPADAQQAKKVVRIGILLPGTEAATVHLIGAFRQGLRELGYKEGQDIILERRYGESKFERLSDLAAELVQLKVDIIVTTTDPAIQAAKQHTETIPIVMGNSSDPVGTGFIVSLARPGGNITGFTATSPELNGKRLELFKEAIPKISRVAFLWNPDVAAATLDHKETETAARLLKLHFQSVEVRHVEDIDSALAALTKERANALILPGGNPVLYSSRSRIVEFAAKRRLPAMYANAEFVDAGGLMSYGANTADLFRRAATYVDKILKGAKPADLPVEVPTKFEFVINLKTAKQIGLTIPQSVLYRADKVIK
jgi:putative ABC transport system substrate-binding protein